MAHNPSATAWTLDEGTGDPKYASDPAGKPGALDLERLDLLSQALHLWSESAQRAQGKPADPFSFKLVPNLAANCILFEIRSGHELATAFIGKAMAGNFASRPSLVEDGGGRECQVIDLFKLRAAELLENGSPLDFEFTTRDSNGTMTAFRGTVLPYYSDEDAVDFILGVFDVAGSAPPLRDNRADELILEMQMELGDDERHSPLDIPDPELTLMSGERDMTVKPDPIVRVASPWQGDAQLPQPESRSAQVTHLGYSAPVEREEDPPCSNTQEAEPEVFELTEDIEQPREENMQLARHWHEMWADVATRLWTGSLKPRSVDDLKWAMIEGSDLRPLDRFEAEIEECAGMLWRKYVATRRVTSKIGQIIEEKAKDGSQILFGAPSGARGLAARGSMFGPASGSGGLAFSAHAQGNGADSRCSVMSREVSGAGTLAAPLIDCD